MGESFQVIAAEYKKGCSVCRNEGFVPKRQTLCVDCLAREYKLGPYEEICLCCGEKTSKLKGGNRICWNCLRSTRDRLREEFVATLDARQKELFERYWNWDDAWTSAIILD